MSTGSEPAWLAHVISLFPQEFAQACGMGVTGAAIERGTVALKTWNPRDFTQDKHRRVDDRPYGGGPGMVMQYQPLSDTLAAVRRQAGADGLPLVCLSPQGKPLTQQWVRQAARAQGMIFLCGRYEGIDERFIKRHVDEEISLGDFVLSGGELAAAVIVDAVTRMLPGVLGHSGSAEQDSFSEGLLDCPHYSRPEEVDNMRVPPVLLGGDHAAIERWRRQQMLGRTWLRRPELLETLQLSDQDQRLLEQWQRDNGYRN